MNASTTLRVLATAAFAATIAVNAMANLLPINGLTTGEVSDRFPSLFTPAGFTFSIWSVIYLLLAGFIVFIWRLRQVDDVTRLLPLFILSCVLNISWILVWHHLFAVASVAIMLGILASMTALFVRSQKMQVSGMWEVVFLKLPFAVYFAWICVATIANISACLNYFGWEGFQLSPETWTTIMITVAMLLGIWLVYRYRTVAIPAVLLWTFAGIFARWNNTEHNSIALAAAVLSVVLIVSTLLLMRGRPA